MTIGGQHIEIGASVGIAVGPGDGTSTDQLVKNADLRVYKAKSEGRSTYHFFEPAMDAELQQRRSIEAGLRLALQRDELRLMFQPCWGWPTTASAVPRRCCVGARRADHLADRVHSRGRGHRAHRAIGSGC